VKQQIAALSVVLALAAATTPAFAQALVSSRPGLGFFALAGGPNPAPQTVSISTAAGSAAAGCAITSTQPPRLTVTPAATTGTFSLSVNTAGLPAGTHRATVVLNCNGTPVRIPVMLTIVSAAPNQSVYEVEFRFIGVLSILIPADTLRECPGINLKGTDVMMGLLAGNEGTPPGEDVTYTGTLLRLTSLDFCETKGKRGPQDDERVWCKASLTGSSTMAINLEVYGESGRGAWLKAHHDGGPFTRSVTGACDRADQLTWEKEYPKDDALKAGDPLDEGGGASPNGQPIDDPSSKLFAGGRARLVVGTFPTQQDAWTLTVIRRLR
jgi:hypothetical protein